MHKSSQIYFIYVAQYHNHNGLYNHNMTPSILRPFNLSMGKYMEETQEEQQIRDASVRPGRGMCVHTYSKQTNIVKLEYG